MSDKTAPVVSEREAFEAHWYDFYHSGSIQAREDGTYITLAVQTAWEAWQARAALAERGKPQHFCCDRCQRIFQGPGNTRTCEGCSDTRTCEGCQS